LNRSKHTQYNNTDFSKPTKVWKISACLLLWLFSFLFNLSLGCAWEKPAIFSKPKNVNIYLSPVPPTIAPETIPIIPGRNATTSGDAEDTASPDFMRYEPYNIYPHELDLWELESKRFVRGPSVISPDKSTFVYTEVVFVPYNRQTFSRLYRVVAPPLPGLQREETDPNDVSVNAKPAPISIESYTDRYSAEKTIQYREMMAEVGYDKVKRFDFRTLTVVDWSASGRRLLVKEKSGMLHIGLRTSDIIVYDEKLGSVTLYPEIRRIIEYYWRTKGNLPNLNRLVWELYPLGWEPGSDSIILIKAWTMDKEEKKFLGIWRYDLDTERAELFSPENSSVPTAANGYIGTPTPVPPPKPDRRHGI
jgi:hypothetical protein